MTKRNKRDLLIGVNPFWLSVQEQMYNCQKWLANSLKAGSAAPVGRDKVAPTGAMAIYHGDKTLPAFAGSNAAEHAHICKRINWTDKKLRRNLTFNVNYKEKI